MRWFRTDSALLELANKNAAAMGAAHTVLICLDEATTLAKC
jgi:hypothetical protein